MLDKLYKSGLNQIFVAIVLEVMKKYKLNVETTHLDSSSFHVHGQYETVKTGELEEPKVINITYGYSRDHRPDLKQFVMDLICTSDGDVPLWMRTGSGNESDQKQFAKAMIDFKKQLRLDSLMVADSAFYTQENIGNLKNMRWISRVPLTVKNAKKLVSEIESDQFTKSQLTGYSYLEVKNNYGGIEQRWVVVESEKRRESDLKVMEKRIEKDWQLALKKIGELRNREFACVTDAEKAAVRSLRKVKYHEITKVKIKANDSKISPKKSKKPNYKVEEVIIAVCLENVERDRKQAGRFILATNVLDRQNLASEEILSKYKDQQSVERGFSFLKDPMFLTDSVFLKSNTRIESLGLIMGLCLLVYTLGQRELRQTLKRTKTGVKNQLGKLTNRPTLRWIFQCFQSIHVLATQGAKQISNLTKERLELLEFFPVSCQRYYLLV